ncbi:DEAD/DEAH box helicase [Thermoanaerobacterium sp. RBIITD]|uniref:DEAD/DEAH box helicase n=1 Tax=Thermoanaerobacterium sp. RBIITD TaxID=1550240 RepID=UPI000BB7B688|nr:DEAD/DEAH box helicase [Thermoanaerobacterium sp. RBIITD]SNX53990.1 Superfamily II DNA or RNA helicase, SNF2 family [Thermoanaerobacterium sp. RBIITD]
MFDISESEIKKRCFDTFTYKRGLEYYVSGRIHDLSLNKDGTAFQAIVTGTKEYYVRVQQYNGELFTSCTCPAKMKYKGDCKHIVAVLTYIKNHRDDIIDFLESGISNELFEAFEEREYIPESVKQPVNIEITLECGLTSLPAISLRMGIDKLYVVKSIKKFFEDTDNGEVVEFGKNFSFDPRINTFKDEDKKFIQFLREIYEIDKFNTEGSYYRIDPILTGKYVRLTPSNLEKFFEIVKDGHFNVSIGDKTYYDVKVVDGDLPIKFKLEKGNNGKGINVNVEGIENLSALSEKGNFFMYDGVIYKISSRQRYSLVPFYNLYVNNRVNKITFKEKDKFRFASTILPEIDKAGSVVIDENIKSSFYKEPLVTKIYLDKEYEKVTADINFTYGIYNINLYNPDKTNITKDCILIRDEAGEKSVLEIFERAEFKIKDNRVYIDNEEAIYNFIVNLLPALQKRAEVYYSESFKAIKLYKRSYSGRIRLRDDNLLEFSFSIDDIDQDLIPKIFDSIRRKKKFFRLPDGSFLPIEDDDLRDIVNLADELDLNDKDLKKNIINIPKYKALYLDERLKKDKVQIERDLKFRELVKNIKEPQETTYEIPKELRGTLRNYQVVGFKWLKTLASYGLGGILADDMGLGKTIQTIAFLLSEREKYKEPAIVICPTTLVYNWESEINKFAPSLKTTVISGNKSERNYLRKNIKESDIVITSYPLIRRDIDDYDNIKFSYCILDEAQYIKNPNSQNAESVKRIKAKGYFALTGTPIENSLTELWSIFDFLMPGYLLSHRKFVEKYEKPIIKENNKEKLVDLNRHIKPFVLRRLKKDVLKELPQKIETTSVAELTKEQKELYMAYLENAKGEIAEEIRNKGFERSQIKIISALTRLRQICCHPSMFIENYKGDSGKMELLMELLNELKDGGHRVLLFSQFTTALKLIEEKLKKEKISYLYLDGQTKSEDRGALVKAFNEGKANVFLISLKAGGTGLNLTGADTVIHFDPWWNPAVEDQATDRAHRIGQINTVQVIKLITQGTIEEKIIKLQEKKKEIINSVINPGETFITRLSEEEVKELFAM